jgi:hypothetical protein
MQSIFGVLEKYHGFAKHISFGAPSSVGCNKLFGFENHNSISKTVVFLEF